mgnify:CR=1 FL=1
MKKLFISVCFLFFSIIIQASPLDILSNKKLGVAIKYPYLWKCNTYNLHYSYIYKLVRNKYTSITIQIINSDKEEQYKWSNWKKWYFSGYGYIRRFIINDRKIIINNKIKGNFYLFEFTAHGKRFLERLVIGTYKNKYYVINCTSRLHTFSRYRRLFDAVIAGIEIK